MSPLPSLTLHTVRLLILCLLLFATFPCIAALAAPAPATPGLTASGARVLKDGKPCRAIGANFFDLFDRALKQPADPSWKTNLERLAQAGIPFVRFRACGFWPVDFALYKQDKAAWFARMDEVVRAAEAARIGLIPSLFWHAATVPDLVGEPLDQLGNPQSKTAAFIRQYTAEVVGRYKDSPAIWAWEMGNEYNLGADLPNAAQHRPPVWPTLGTPAQRTERDELTSTQVAAALRVFAEEVRRHDPHRLILSGASIPRPSAWHNRTEKSWKLDSPEEFHKVLLSDNPAPMDSLSVHIYPREGKEPYAGGAQSLADLIARVAAIATEAGRPLFIGEFGAPRTPGRVASIAVYKEMLSAIESSNVPLAAFWVYDFKAQDKDWNVTFDNDRAEMIRLAAEANRRMQETQ